MLVGFERRGKFDIEISGKVFGNLRS